MSRADLLVDAGITLASGLDLESVLTKLVELACQLTEARYGALGVIDRTGLVLDRFITHGLDREERAAIGPEPAGRGILGVLISDARPLRLADLGADQRSSGFPANHPPMVSFLGVPVIAGGRVFGNLYLTEKASGEFTEEDTLQARALAAQAGVAIQNAQLYADVQEHAAALERAVSELSSVQEINEAILSEQPQQHVLALICERARASLQARSVTIVAAAPGAQRIPVPDEITAPLAHRDQLEGQLVATGRLGGAPFTREDEQVLGLFAARVTLALGMARSLRAERERSDAEARLLAAHGREDTRRETLRRVVEAQESERRRIARELHDDTGQSLVSVLMGLRLAEGSDDPAATRVILADLRDTITTSIRDLRALAVELRPTALDDFGLQPALERLTDTFARRTALTIELQTSGLELRLPAPIETALYRIVQEALTNIAKHAGAGIVSVVAQRIDTRAVLIIEDDGRGFDPEGFAEGLGLISMRERAELVGGRFRIDSSPGAGTTIAVEITL